MKKYIFITIAAISVLAVGCKKEVAPIDEPTPIENNVIEEQPIAGEDLVTYSFTIDNKDLKSILENDGTFAWELGDSIAIYNTTSSSYVGFKVTALEAGVATIEGSAPAGAAWTNAIYPAARAAGSGDAVDYTVPTVAGPILVSKVEGTALSFKYLGAVANIRIDGVPGTPTTLTFTANANVFGNRSFNWSGETPVLGGGGSQASITVPFTKNAIVSVPIPQVSYAGFTIAVKNSSGRVLYKKTTANTFDMTSYKLLPMPTLTYVEPGYYVKTTSSSGYWDRNAVRMIQTGANTYELSENCDGNTTYYIYDEYNADQPTTAYLATGLAKSSFSTGDSEWSLVGDINGNNWNIANNHVAMQYEGDWHYVRNITFDNIVDEDPTYAHFLIVKGTNWESVTKYCEANIFPGNTYTAYATEGGSWDLYAKGITAGTEYDFFFNINTKEVRLFLSSANHDPNEASGVWKFTYNSSSSTASLAWKSGTKDDPFGDSAFPTNGYGIKGSWNDWGTPYTSKTTYDNQSWVISDFTPGAAGSFNFGLCDSSSNHWTDLSTDSTFATVNPGSNLYGTLTYWGDGSHGNPSVTLENVKYDVYVNVNPDVNGGVNLMFVKK